MQYRKNTTLVDKKQGSLRVLLCGDFDNAATIELFYLEKAALFLPEDTEFVFKPHPAHPLKISDYCALKVEVKDSMLIDLLSEVDKVFVTNSASVAVDAYCCQVPVIQLVNAKTFNTSPLLGLDNVTYVKNEDELLKALMDSCNTSSLSYTQYFNLSEKLVGWRRLFNFD